MTLLDKLIRAYEQHGKIIVGVDFDDTLFTFDKSKEELHKDIRKLLLDLKQYIIICLYTVADDQSIIYKAYIMEHCWDIKPDYINCGPLDDKWNSKKPFFNILLDDKAGLEQTYDILDEFKEYINK